MASAGEGEWVSTGNGKGVAMLIVRRTVEVQRKEWNCVSRVCGEKHGYHLLYALRTQ